MRVDINTLHRTVKRWNWFNNPTDHNRLPVGHTTFKTTKIITPTGKPVFGIPKNLIHHFITELFGIVKAATEVDAFKRVDTNNRAGNFSI